MAKRKFKGAVQITQGIFLQKLYIFPWSIW